MKMLFAMNETTTGFKKFFLKILKIGSRYGTIILSNNVLYRELFQEKEANEFETVTELQYGSVSSSFKGR